MAYSGYKTNKSGCTSVNFPASKRPKLDIQVPVSLANEALWGDDLPVEDLDECFLLASQMCTDTQPPKPPLQTAQIQPPLPHNTSNWYPSDRTLPTKQTASAVTNRPQQPQVKTSGQLNKNVVSSEHSIVQAPEESATKCQSMSFHSDANVHNTEKDALKTVIKNLTEENKKWKENLFTKDGEVSNLRLQLKQSEAKQNTQRELITNDYEEKMRILKRELEKERTTVELHKLEAWKATDRLLMTSQSVVDVSEQHTDDRDDELIFKANVCESSGSILNDLLTPHLYGKSDLEIHEVKLESKFSLHVSTTNRKRASWKPSLYPFRLSVESSWSLVNQLGLQDSFETVKSTCFTQSIFVECRAVLYGLLLTLQERGKEETLELLDSRDRQLIESQVTSLDNPDLLSNEMWYDVERGLEARRALGLLSNICTLSKHMSGLVFGISNKSVVGEERCEDPAQLTDHSGGSHFVFVECNHDDVDVAMMDCNESTSKADLHGATAVQERNGEINFLHDDMNVYKRSDQEISKQKELILKYENEENGFLHLLHDLTNMILSQRNSLEYSGFLAGIVTLLTSSLRKAMLPAAANSVVSDIIRAVVFSRPRIEAVVALSELLFALSSNIQVMETLCNGLENKAYVDIACGLGFFKANSCVIQILCWLLELRNSSVASRTRLCRSVVDWVWACIKRRPHRGPAWAQCSSDETASACFCRARLAEVTVKLIYQTYRDFELLALTEHGEGLRKALVRGIVLLHQLTETDTEFGTHMQEAEGCYQWLLIGLRNTPHDLALDHDEGEALRELLAMEDATEPHPFIETKQTEQHLQDICVSLKSCWAIQSISHHVTTDTVEGE